MDVDDVHVLLLAGQSNMSGRASPCPRMGLPCRRVFQYGATRRKIEKAPTVLDMHDSPSGFSYASVFAREYLVGVREETAVLLVPAAHGGTGFTSTTQDPPPAGYSTHSGGTWQVGYGASSVNLYRLLLDQVTDALAAARAFFGVPPTVKALLWHQGETDVQNAVSGARYRACLQTLVDGVRAHVADPRLPVVLGGMSPDWMASNPASEPIHRAHVDLCRADGHTAFVPGRPGSGLCGDEVHYGLEGAVDLGARTVRAYYSIIERSRAPSSAGPPPARDARASRP